MEIKIFPVLVCALILLWTTQELHGYTGQGFNQQHVGNRGSGKKKNEILPKVRLQKYVLLFGLRLPV